MAQFSLGPIDRGLRKVCDIKFNQNIKSPQAHLLVSIFKIPFCDIIHRDGGSKPKKYDDDDDGIVV